jgi:hypothetical protein
MSTIDPEDVKAALARAKIGDTEPEVLAVLLAAAEAYSAMTLEWGLQSPQASLFYVSRNDMLIETMHAARPELDPPREGHPRLDGRGHGGDFLMAPYWRIRRERVGSSYMWRIYYLGQRHAAYWTWARCIYHIDNAIRAMGANFGGRL